MASFTKKDGFTVQKGVMLMQELCEAIGDLKSIQGAKKKYESYSPGVRAIFEVGQLTKDWTVVDIPVLQRGEYHINLWFDKKNPSSCVAVLFDHHFKTPGAKGEYPLSYAPIVNVELDIVALVGRSQYRKIANQLPLGNDAFGLAANM